jgi:hypothetical protein
VFSSCFLQHNLMRHIRKEYSSVNKEELMRLLAVIFGMVLIVLVAQDAFETIVLPRRVTRRIRLARLFYRLTRIGWKSIGHLIQSSTRRESYLGYLGPVLATQDIRSKIRK